ncbi:MAG: undecaprenyl-diphosphatase UppP [Bacteroidota bacterium]
MNLLEAILLGIIQGLTEFIPISSTAHLTIAGDLLGLVDPDHPKRWTSFIAIIQLGTLAAVLVYFQKEVRLIPWHWIKENFIQKKKYAVQSYESKMGWLIIAGSVPIIIVGFTLKDFIQGSFTKDPIVIASSLIILALILFMAEKMASFKKDITDIGWKDSIIVGIAQCFALIPGSSRSGTTITAGLFTGMKRDVAARFSFLLSIPAILGSGLLSFFESLEYVTSDEILMIIVATIVSGISGYAAIEFLLRYLKKHSTILFVNYRIILGVLLIFLVYTAVL